MYLSMLGAKKVVVWAKLTDGHDRHENRLYLRHTCQLEMLRKRFYVFAAHVTVLIHHYTKVIFLLVDDLEYNLSDPLICYVAVTEVLRLASHVLCSLSDKTRRWAGFLELNIVEVNPTSRVITNHKLLLDVLDHVSLGPCDEVRLHFCIHSQRVRLRESGREWRSISRDGLYFASSLWLRCPRVELRCMH